jgi:hypothetical protein
MRKSNYNFILKPSNVGEFIKRINKLISITGCLSEQTIYHSKEISNIIKKFDSKTFKSYLNVLESQKGFLLKDKISFDTYPSTVGNMERYDCFNEWNKAEGIIIRIHYDACLVYYWGQKFNFTSTEIKTIGNCKIEKYQKRTHRKSTTIFKIFDDIEYAKNVIYYEELYAKDYYDSMLNDSDLEELLQLDFEI